MDRRTIGAFAIIALIIIATPYYMRWARGEDPLAPPPKPPTSPLDRTARDSAVDDATRVPASDHIADRRPSADAEPGDGAEKPLVEHADTSQPEVRTTVETDRFTAVLSSRGGRLVSMQLKDYEAPQGGPVELIPPGAGGLAVLLGDRDLSQVHFEPDRTTLTLSGGQQGDVVFTADVAGRRIEKRLRFQGDRYRMSVDLSQSGGGSERLGLLWDGPLAHTEEMTVRDPTYSKIMTLAGGEVESWDPERLRGEDVVPSGRITWVGVRTKYFTAAIIPREGRYELDLASAPEVQVVAFSDETGRELESLMASGRLQGVRAIRDSEFQGQQAFVLRLRSGVDPVGLAETLQQSLTTGAAIADNHLRAGIVPEATDKSAHYGVYVGPVTYQLLRAQNTGLDGEEREVGMDNFMDYGWAFFRPIMKPLTIIILRGFFALHEVIPNYGLVIIVFSILVKITVFPLTHKSLESAAKMQQLQPQMTALKEKYGDDQQKLNQEMMNLYKEQKINPLGGCLPMLLQMPILISLFNVFRSAIELRQAGFLLWITDLSQPDSTGIMLPLFGELHVLPLLMAVSTFLQSKMTMKDPKQAAMVYVMPVMMTFFFWNFASGLVLYWTMFNLLTLVQQRAMEMTKEALGNS